MALGCGLRLGAALGLTRADIDLDGGTVRVRQALQRAGRDSAVRRALTAERRRLKNARVRYQKGIFIVKYEGKRAKGQKYALNPSRIEDITTLANEGTVSDPLVEQWFFKDNILVSARDLDDDAPVRVSGITPTSHYADSSAARRAVGR